jgi:hypothetical protein
MPEEREGKIHQTKRMNPRLAFPGTMGWCDFRIEQ